MKFKQYLNEKITIPIEVGDVVLGGKFKNKRITVKKIGKNEKGEVTINGKPMMRYRVIPTKEKANLDELENLLIDELKVGGSVKTSDGNGVITGIKENIIYVVLVSNEVNNGS